ncbi:cytochrome c oxidase subunit 6b-3-like isoform X1 [Actinidia eriantha]|uniref:cytochrome c oxidase subunit 6b-3-like isoform X1 n=1 Tax=Actinidia eriantha TaxID=165200 RepID=UPI002582A787|nr:cytochrome c oxidase subunit 6b-3-like isoform X1 [Actinidia eriantha]
MPVDSVVDPHDKMRARDVSKVATGEQSPRPAHEPGSIDTSKSPHQPSIKVEEVGTAPFDWRFPTTNQTRHCYTRYLEFHRCIQVKGKGAAECEKFAKYYRSLCPSEWIERWNEQRRLRIFPGPF